MMPRTVPNESRFTAARCSAQARNGLWLKAVDVVLASAHRLRHQHRVSGYAVGPMLRSKPYTIDRWITLSVFVVIETNSFVQRFLRDPEPLVPECVEKDLYGLAILSVDLSPQ